MTAGGESESQGEGERRRDAAAGGAAISRVDALLFALTVALLALLPWLVGYWPAEEEPRRLAIAHAAIDQHRPDSPYAGLLDPAAPVDPTGAFLVAASRLFGPMAAGRLACSLAIAALCLAQCFLLRRLAPERWTNVYLVLPLATGPLLMRGGTPLMFGLSLAFAAIGLLVRGHTLGRDWPGAAVAALLLALSGLTSPLAMLLGGAMLVLLLGRRMVSRRGWLLAAALAAAALPAAARAVHELRASTGGRWTHATLDDRVLGILGADLATFSGWEWILRGAPLLILLAGAAVAWRTAQRSPARRPPERSPPAVPVRRLLAGALALSVLMPSVAGMPACSKMAADQLLWMACALALAPPRRLRPAAAGAVGLALAAALTLVHSCAMQRPVAAIEQVVAAGRSLPAGSRVLPLRFAPPDRRRIDPVRHAWAYVALERDIVTPFLVDGNGPLLSCASPLPLPAAPPGPDMPHLGEDAAARIEALDPHRCFPVTEPALDCTCAAWKQLRYAALVDAARSYDRVLVIAPTAEFVAAAEGELVLLLRSGDVHVFAPRPGAHPHAARAAGARLLCPR